MPNIEQLNETLRKEIATIIAEEVDFADGLITVSYVDCDPNFFSAKVAVSVLPDSQAGTALDKLRKSSGAIVKELKNRVRLRKMPHLLWRFDPTEKNVNALDQVFEEAEKEKKMSDKELSKLEDVNYE